MSTDTAQASVREYQRHEYHHTGQEAYLAPFVAPLGVRDGLSFVDVGCGSGYVNAYVGTRHRLRQNVGIEIDLDTLHIAQELNAGLTTIHWVCGSAEQLPVATGSVDCLVCRGVIPLATVDEVVKEFSRILAHGGRVVMLLHHWTTYLRWLSLDPRAWRRTCSGLFHFGLGLWFNVTGRQMRWTRHGRPFGQTFQSIYRMRRVLARHDLRLTETVRGKEFLIYGTKATAGSGTDAGSPHRGPRP